jgi:TDG/mug DNA glycosylase family protein
MNKITGFAPLVGSQPRILILGSVPSVASLERHEYYGKQQNAFWRIMGELFAAGPALAYEQRVAKLTGANVAVWDVLASCVRPGSLDSAIEMRTAEVNDFSSFLAKFPTIEHVFFNGRKAEDIYSRRVLPEIKDTRADIHYYCLPSTSPAMAALTFEQKLQSWSVVANALES